MNHLKTTFKILSFCAICYVFYMWGALSSGADEIDDIIPFIIQVESGGDASAIGKAGEVGLMQISPIVWLEYCQENDYMNPDGTPYSSAYYTTPTGCPKDLADYSTGINKMVGEWYLRRLRDHYLKDIRIQRVQIPAEAKDYFIVWRQNKYGEPEYFQNSNQEAKKYNLTSIEDMELALVLATYNWGIGNMRSVDYDINKSPKSVQRYVKKIMQLYHSSTTKKR